MSIREFIQFFKEKIYDVFDFRKDENVVEDLAEKTEIPTEYLKRFSHLPIENIEQLFGRNLELELLKKAYDNWKISNNLLLVIGEHGTGVSSLINSSCHLYPHAKIINESIDISNTQLFVNELKNALGLEIECNSLNKLKLAIYKEEVVIIENIERLFLRTIDGFSRLDDFLLFMHETKHLIYWICTVNRYSHYYLNQVKSINSNFLSQISVRSLESDVVNSILQKRNEGFSVSILKPLDMNASGERKLKKVSPEERIKLLETRYYKKLNEYALGNVSRAFIYWINSVVHTNEKNVFLREPDTGINSALSQDDLFVLEAILQHSYIKLSEIREVLRNTYKASMLILEQLKEKDLVEEKMLYSNTQVFQINLEFLEEVKTLFRTRLNRKIK